MSYLTLTELRALVRRARKRGERPDPYVRIALAAEEGRGVHLSAEEIMVMGGDDALLRAADTAYPDDLDEIRSAGEGVDDGG